MAGSTGPFDRELARYAATLPAWLEAGLEGRWAVVGGDEVLGPFPTYAEAWRAGMACFGKPGFMVKQVCAVERPVFASHVRWRRPE